MLKILAQPISIIIISIISIVLFMWIGFYFGKIKTRTKMNESLIKSEAENRSLEKQIEQIYDQQRFETESKGKEVNIIQMLGPIQENLRAMESKISMMERERLSQFSALNQQLMSSQNINENLRDTTHSLLSAFKSSKIRGSWGEMQLRNIIESSGLTEYIDFDLQKHINTEDGTIIPDLILNMPGNKKLLIDSKVPFDSYIQAVDEKLLLEPGGVGKQEELMKKHSIAFRSHIKSLSAKEYWKHLDGSPDFVIIFVPNEGLLSAALENDSTLLEYAFNQKIALSSPTSLWTMLKTISYSWQQELLSQKVKDFFDLSKELYTRINKVAEYSEELRKNIDNTVNSYNKFSGSLERQVLTTARKLSILDETILIPEIREIESSTNEFKKLKIVPKDEEMQSNEL